MSEEHLIAAFHAWMQERLGVTLQQEPIFAEFIRDPQIMKWSPIYLGAYRQTWQDYLAGKKMAHQVQGPVTAIPPSAVAGQVPISEAPPPIGSQAVNAASGAVISELPVQTAELTETPSGVAPPAVDYARHTAVTAAIAAGVSHSPEVQPEANTAAEVPPVAAPSLDASNVDEPGAAESGLHMPQAAASEPIEQIISHSESEQPAHPEMSPPSLNLWKELDPPADSPYPKPHFAFDCLNWQGRLVVGASLRGRSHAHQGTFRDDHFALAVADDWLLLAVSDGAGSARYSRYGAERLCEGTLAQLKDYLPQAGIEEKWLQWQAQPGPASEQSLKVVLYNTLVHSTFQQVKALEHEALGRDAQLRDYSATLLLAACRPWEGGWLVVSFWIGDGALACLAPEQVTLLGQPDSGEFSGQTRFATMLDLYRQGYEGLAPRLSFHFTQNLQALLLLSDGITDPKFVSETALSDRAAWEPLWQELQRLYAPLQGLEPAQRREQGAEAFRLWLNEVWMAGEYDDRTILGVF